MFNSPIFRVLGLHHSMALAARPVFLRLLLHASTLEVEHTRAHLTADEYTLPMTFPAVVVILVVLRGEMRGV
ncbi:hypothetical protein E2C01_087732 [Portunus trituberculatus]|uniref:Uncharacterized protein n=1 Tax=Portunus trituberculatus TaxID=210409 RepID=A0A5B7J4A8_PORTR|nr:hypothetical protein [Portunus trituberculatus]